MNSQDSPVSGPGVLPGFSEMLALGIAPVCGGSPEEVDPQKRWIAERDFAGRVSRIVGHDGGEVMAAASYDGDWWIEVDERALALALDAPAMKAELDRLRAANAELLAALRPFAALAEQVDEWRHEDNSTCTHRLKASDVRAARAAIAKAT